MILVVLNDKPERSVSVVNTVVEADGAVAVTIALPVFVPVLIIVTCIFQLPVADNVKEPLSNMVFPAK